MYIDLPYDNPESVTMGDYAVATYIVSDVAQDDAFKKAGAFAVGQTVGTWIKLPGVTQQMVEQWQARVVGLYMVTPDLQPERPKYVMRIAFPMHNFAGCFAMMMTALVGNDVSTALPLRLVDIELGQRALSHFKGPRQSVQGIRRLAGVYERPLILNMIKPCIGYTLEDGTKLFYESGISGVDLIKDDEVMGDVEYTTVKDRVRAYLAAGRRIKEEIGKEPVYFVNITASPKRMHENARAVIDLGAKAVMINFVAAGADVLHEISEEYGDKLCILGHYAGCDIMNSAKRGVSDSVALGVIPRLAGADAVMVMSPHLPGHLEYVRTLQKHQLPLGEIRPVFSAIGGGITPMNLGRIIREAGRDTILGIGGAMQGHPMGMAAGLKAVMAALDAALSDRPLAEAADACAELRTAIDVWGMPETS
ncbi:MAG: RuBisCO large subunit C-terminal-like domain-containing protein [Christensenellales bacterium]|jgi:2,3-diketo-5-methylthiopentyl-1-phosphate enolase